MTSQRKLKKRAAAMGMTGPEMRLVEMLQEVLADLRWMQILAYTNQYLLNQKLSVSAAERDQILEAATRAVDKDAKLHERNERLAKLKAEIKNIERRVGSEHRVLDGGGDSGEAPGETPGVAPGREQRGEAPSGGDELGQSGAADA